LLATDVRRRPQAWGINEYYRTEEEYFHALAAEISKEYRAIVDAGFLLQVDERRFVQPEAANPHHEHEYHLFERVKLPDGKVICPG